MRAEPRLRTLGGALQQRARGGAGRQGWAGPEVQTYGSFAGLVGEGRGCRLHWLLLGLRVVRSWAHPGGGCLDRFPFV